MASNFIKQHFLDVNDEKAKDAYWICLAFMMYNDIQERDPNSVQDNRKLMSRLDQAFTVLENYSAEAYWAWHDLLDILDVLAPYEQEWIDELEPQEEKERIENVILQPGQFCKACWYWLDILINGVDEVDQS